MMRSLLLCALAAPALGALELTPDNFDKEVLQSGKAAFIKFLAPW
jgi:protein disulfide-isomerase A6